MDEMQTVDKVIEAFGGSARMAEIFGVVPSAVSNWRVRGFPDSFHFYSKLTAEARKRGFVISPKLFGGGSLKVAS